MASEAKEDVTQPVPEPGGGFTESDSSNASADEMPYLPAEDHDQGTIEANETQSLVIKCVHEAHSKMRKPYIRISCWTTWRRKREMKTRVKQLAGNKTLFDFWNIERNSKALCIYY